MSLSFDVEVYRLAAVVRVRRGPRPGRMTWTRGEVSGFSDRSKRRLLFAANNAAAEWSAFGVATYPAEWPRDGQEVKRDVHNFLTAYDRVVGGHDFWGLEFQKRGAPHINFLFDEFVPKDWFSEVWYRIVGSGDERHLRAGTSIESLVSRETCIGYIASRYLAKNEQKEVPPGFEHVGRYWGMSRGILKPVRVEEISDYGQGVAIVRAMRKFIEKGLRVARVRPEREGVKRKRSVHRKRAGFLHQARLQGVTSYKGAKVADRLLDGVGSLERRSCS